MILSLENHCSINWLSSNRPWLTTCHIAPCHIAPSIIVPGTLWYCLWKTTVVLSSGRPWLTTCHIAPCHIAVISHPCIIVAGTLWYCLWRTTVVLNSSRPWLTTWRPSWTVSCVQIHQMRTEKWCHHLTSSKTKSSSRYVYRHLGNLTMIPYISD